LKATIQLPVKNADVPATMDQITTMRTFPNFSCRAKDEYLLKKLKKKQASELIDRLKKGEEIELKG